MPVTAMKDGKVVRYKVAPKDHPAAIVSWLFDLPTALTGEPTEGGMVGRPIVRTIHPDFSRRVSAIDGQVNLIDRNPVSPDSLVLVLAKSAHAYAMAKIGPKGFQPLLCDLILGKGANYFARYVGGAGRRNRRVDQVRHTMSLDWETRVDGKRFLIVTIRLFGDLGLPTYRVVTGEEINPEAPYEPTQPHPIARIQLSGICDADGHLTQTSLVPLSDRHFPVSNEDAAPKHLSLTVPHPTSQPLQGQRKKGG
jgi:hypothetical protein